MAFQTRVGFRGPSLTQWNFFITCTCVCVYRHLHYFWWLALIQVAADACAVGMPGPTSDSGRHLVAAATEAIWTANHRQLIKLGKLIKIREQCTQIATFAQEVKKVKRNSHAKQVS